VPRKLWLIAGPNGSGKTTLVKKGPLSAVLGAISILNPDDRTQELLASGQGLSLEDANRRAAVEITDEVKRRVVSGEDVGVETVLSSRKYVEVVRAAKEKAYATGMIYVTLPSVEYSIRRVQQRVASGGHDVPEAKLYSRWGKSHDNLIEFLPFLDELYVFDNSAPNGEVVLVAQKEGGGGIQILVPGTLPEVEARVRASLNEH
jgi:predicted ABC-type ATPase